MLALATEGSVVAFLLFHALRPVLMRLALELTGASFVDNGSAKRRLLLVASHFPFREVIGVEFSRELPEIAERNIAIYRDPEQRCRNIRSVRIDACEFRLPGTSLVCYFCNSFDDE